MRPFAETLLGANILLVTYLINSLCSEPIPCNKSRRNAKIMEACEFLTDRDVEIVQIPTTQGPYTVADEYEETVKEKEEDYDSIHWDTFYATHNPMEKAQIYGGSRHNDYNDNMLLNIKPVTYKPERKSAVELRDALFSNTENENLDEVETHTTYFVDQFINYNKKPPNEIDRKERNWLEYTQHRTIGEMLTNKSLAEMRREKYAKLKVKPSRQKTTNAIEPYKKSSIKSYLYKHLYKSLTSPRRRKMLFKEKHQSHDSTQNNPSTELNGIFYQNDYDNEIAVARAKNEHEHVKNAIENEIKLAKHAAVKKTNTAKQYAPIPHLRRRKAKAKFDIDKRKPIKRPKAVLPLRKSNVQIQRTTVKAVTARKKSLFQDPEYFIDGEETNDIEPVTVSTNYIKTVFKEPKLFMENGGMDESADDDDAIAAPMLQKKQMNDETEIGVVKKKSTNVRVKTAAPPTKKVIYYYWAKVKTTSVPKTTEINEVLASTDMGYEYINNFKDKHRYTIANDEYGEREA